MCKSINVRVSNSFDFDIKVGRNGIVPVAGSIIKVDDMYIGKNITAHCYCSENYNSINLYDMQHNEINFEEVKDA